MYGEIGGASRCSIAGRRGRGTRDSRYLGPPSIETTAITRYAVRNGKSGHRERLSSLLRTRPPPLLRDPCQVTAWCVSGRGGRALLRQPAPTGSSRSLLHDCLDSIQVPGDRTLHAAGSLNRPPTPRRATIRPASCSISTVRPVSAVEAVRSDSTPINPSKNEGLAAFTPLKSMVTSPSGMPDARASALSRVANVAPRSASLKRVPAPDSGAAVW